MKRGQAPRYTSVTGSGMGRGTQLDGGTGAAVGDGRGVGWTTVGAVAGVAGVGVADGAGVGQDQRR
jgi:hypothetical protein